MQRKKEPESGLVVPTGPVIAEIYRQPEFRQERLSMAEHGLDWKHIEAIRWAVRKGRVGEG